jgi:tripartite-type tricarboxylate transporter receptor subunit TctC
VPQLPDVPTVAEAALPNYKYESWFGVMAPAGTPMAIRTKIAQDIATVLKMKDVIDQMLKVGNIPMPNTPAEFDAIIKSDTVRFSKVIADAGIAPK